ncbi:F-BAR domain only protein 2-like isoform X1 [Ctenocephalides felis]|uniref:F-BAR domain only protein 2-like isoform X1 n=1 Tax=Ctenocephalides felis TaxID=7515 RepID=UPI000E6E4618|nr:F-BAR domain only protein 2-like isoform X1 [Ctenocephalides felis]
MLSTTLLLVNEQRNYVVIIFLSEEKEETEKKIETNAPEVDEDGFCIRPKLERWENDKGSFYSSSDMDSDEEREHKLHVEIKPLTNGSAPMSASVDELRATVETLSLSPLGTLPGRRGSNSEMENNMKRSQSVSQQIGLAQGKSGSELLGLSFCTSPSASAGGSTGSTPTSHHHNHPYAPLQSPSGNPSQTTTIHSPTLGSSTNRYADLGDIFSEVGEITSNIGTMKLSRQTASANSTGSIALPRPPSRRSEAGARGRISPSNVNMSRTDSLSSVGGSGIEFRASFGSSRGPSPLTIGMADTIPLAVAFHEIVHAYFRGTDETMCKVKMSGDMMLSFPSGIVNVFANNPNPSKLWFRIRNSQKLENILPNNQLVSIDVLQSTPDNIILEFNMPALTALLRRQSEQNPTAAYFNVDILKYQIKTKPGAGSCPFQLVSYWKCEQNHTDLKIDYKYNLHAMSSPSPLLNVSVAVPVDGGVTDLHSMPSAIWISENNTCLWKFTELSQHSENKGVGSLRARMEISNGPSTPATIRTQFNCEGTTLSGMEFELLGSGYRLSLVKRRFVSGKYICDGDKHINLSASCPISPPVQSPDSTTSPRNASAAS